MYYEPRTIVISKTLKYRTINCHPFGDYIIPVMKAWFNPGPISGKVYFDGSNMQPGLRPSSQSQCLQNLLDQKN